MADNPRIRSTDEIAKRFQALAERRRAHLQELQRSGRWQRYYTEETLQAHLRSADQTVASWDQLANPGSEGLDRPN
jgi:uncharacterized repeat protein (TIGR03809 family)